MTGRGGRRQLRRAAVEIARQLTALGLDVLKAELPADLRYERDAGRLLAYCQQLDEASQASWALLSAGVTFDEFARQVEIACQASWCLGLPGRAGGVAGGHVHCR